MLVYCYTGEVAKGVWLHMYYACVLLYRRGSEGGVALSLLVSVSQHQTSTGYFFLMYIPTSQCLVHTHTHSHAYTHTWYTHTCTHIHTYTCTHIHTYTCTHIHMHTHTHNAWYTHTHTCTHTWYTHMHTHTHIHTYTCTHIHMHTHTHIHTYMVHTHAHTYIHAHAYTHTSALPFFNCLYMYSCYTTCNYTCIHDYVHTAASYRSIKTLLLNSAQTKVFSVSWLQT